MLTLYAGGPRCRGERRGLSGHGTAEMREAAPRDDRGEDEVPDEAAEGVGPAAVSEEELARARIAYRGSQESARAWRAFTPNPRHHDITYWSMLTSLFVEPGLNRMTLIERVMEQAGVSRSTAE